ncbi:MAG: hypothetical protein JKY00_02740 [Roseicyclus sp.]|nr:hypothetical protein [Roseicyclus sp.]
MRRFYAHGVAAAPAIGRDTFVRVMTHCSIFVAPHLQTPYASQDAN